MLRDPAHRFCEKGFAWRNAVPGRCAGRMRERNNVEYMAVSLHPDRPTDGLLQLSNLGELSDGEFPDRDDQTRPEDFQLVIQPAGAVVDFVRGRERGPRRWLFFPGNNGR